MGWSEFHDDEGRPFYFNEETNETVWSLPSSLERSSSTSTSSSLDDDLLYPWKLLLSYEGCPYYWNALTSEKIFDVDASLPSSHTNKSKGGDFYSKADLVSHAAKGKTYGRWTELLSSNGVYYHCKKTGGVVWEIPPEELIEILQKRNGGSGRSLQSQRSGELEELRRERKEIEKGKRELERMKREIISLKNSSSSSSSSPQQEEEIICPPPTPKNPVTRKKRTSTILAKMEANDNKNKNATTTSKNDKPKRPSKTHFDLTRSNSRAIRRTSVTAPKAKRDKKREDFAKRFNKSAYAATLTGPSLAKAFFPDKSQCVCCHGYIYGCDDKVCQQLGKCLCTLEEGEGTGQVKRRRGKYEGIVKLNKDPERDR